ncbi:hypothetical protein Mapa_011773 [Marchantia paleacea]|nr:hypothetical protein Mapa_011773 [Marchantia paleacea]
MIAGKAGVASVTSTSTCRPTNAHRIRHNASLLAEGRAASMDSECLQSIDRVQRTVPALDRTPFGRCDVKTRGYLSYFTYCKTSP